MYNIRTCKFKIGDKVIVGCGSTSDLMNQVSRNVLGVGTIKHIRPAGENNLCMIDFPTSTEYIEVLDTKLLPAGNLDTPDTNFDFDEISTNKFNNQNTANMTAKKTTKTNKKSKTKENDTILSSVETIEKEIVDTPKSPAKYNVGQFVMLTPNGARQCKESFGLSIGSLCKKLTIKNISFVFDTYRYEVVEFPLKQIPENMIAPLSDNPVKAHLQILDLMSEARIK